MPGPLKNPKHEAFVRALLEGKSAGDAYQSAGFQSADRGNAARLRANPKVQDRLAELQEEIAGQTKITVESLIGELEQARKKATDLKQLSATIRAIEAKAKLAGLMVERSKVEVSGSMRFDSAGTVEEIAAEMVKFFYETLEYTHSVSEQDTAYLYKVYLDAFETHRRTTEEATDKLREEILARPRGSVIYRPQALPSPSNGKDSHRAVTDIE